MGRLSGSIEVLGRWALTRWEHGQAMVSMLLDVLSGLVRIRGKGRMSGRQIVNQVLFTGVDALWLVGLVGLLCGVVIAIQASTNMPRVGISEYFGMVMVIALVRELGPFFTALVVIGRSGTALAAYIGTMQVNREIAALQVMGVNLTYFLVLPAFVGMIISLICLTVYFDVIGVVGGLAVARLLVDVDFSGSLLRVLHALSLADLFVSLAKNILFGATIAIVSCFHGLRVDGVRIVPRAVFRAVVGSMVITMLINVAFTVGFYVR